MTRHWRCPRACRGRARRDRVDGDVAAAHLLGQRPGDHVDGGFGRRVHTELRRRHQHHARRHVHDRAARAHPPRGLLVDDERTPDVDPVDLVELRQVQVGHRGGPVDPRGVDDDVEMPEAVLGTLEEGGHRLLVGDVRRERRAAPALLRDLLDRRAGQVDAAGVRHGDIEPVGGQLGGYHPAHAAGPSGHQGSPGAVFRRTVRSHESSLSTAAHRPLIARQLSVAPGSAPHIVKSRSCRGPARARHRPAAGEAS
jgi:hypothetical protein